MSRNARREFLLSQRERYGSALRDEKSRILDEFVSATGCNRKYAIFILNPKTAPSKENFSRSESPSLGDF